MTSLTQREAEELIKRAQLKAEQLGLRVSIYVVDGSGVPIAFSRMEGAGILTPDIARAKAFTAVAFKRNTKDLSEGLKDRTVAAASILQVAGDKVVLLPGGVLILRDGEIFGAIGVSGGSGDQDHECSLAATQ